MVHGLDCYSITCGGGHGAEVSWTPTDDTGNVLSLEVLLTLSHHFCLPVFGCTDVTSNYDPLPRLMMVLVLTLVSLVTLPKVFIGSLELWHASTNTLDWIINTGGTTSGYGPFCV